MAKHCIIMTAYKDVSSINRFIDVTPKDWGIYIHWDKNPSTFGERDKISKRAVVVSLKKVYWGAWEHIDVILSLMRIAKTDKEYDYFHIVSGQDYYAVNPLMIDKRMSESSECSFVEYFTIPYQRWKKPWESGYGIFQYRTFASYCYIRFGGLRIVNKLFQYTQKLFPFLKRKLPAMELYGSSVYCSLHRDFVTWLLTDKQSQDFINSLKNSTCCEEVVIATLIMNSPFREKCIPKSFRYIPWGRDGLTLTEKDYDAIVESQCFFCRKIDTRLSLKLVNKLNVFLLENE